MSTYSVTCECGASHPVSVAQAGAQMACSCGRSVDVPPLSSLRKSAGQSAVPVGTIGRIGAMIRDGELPVGDVCPYSGRPADHTVFFHVQCESTRSRGGGFTAYGAAIAGALFGVMSDAFASERSFSGEVLGRDTFLQVPVRVSSDILPKLMRKRRQRKLKALLRQTPIYAQLLDEFPEATVEVMRTVPR